MEDKSEKMIAYETKQYSIFKFKSHNRDLNEKSIDKLAKSIEEHGLIQPVVVSSDMYVIDGQHRLAALQKLGWAVIYVVNKAMTSQAILEANSVRKNWVISDWINHHHKLGNADYAALTKAIDMYTEDGFQLSGICDAFIKGKVMSSSAIKNGTFEFDETIGERVIESCIAMEDILDGKAFGTKFVRAIKRIILSNNSFDIDRLVSIGYKEKIRIYNNEGDIVAEIKEKYNKGLSVSDRLI